MLTRSMRSLVICHGAECPDSSPGSTAGSDITCRGNTTINITWTGLLRERADRLLRSHEGEVISKLTEEFERTLIEVALADTAGRKKEAAEKLGWGRNTLTRKLKELGFADTETNDD